MADEKTRVIRQSESPAAAPAPKPLPEPRLVGDKIVFFCPQGHELKVSQAVAGKRGRCTKCGTPVQIPDFGPPAEPEAVADQPADEPTPGEPEPSFTVDAPAASAAPPPPPAAAGGDDVDWNFISGIHAPAAQPAPAESFSGGWEADAGMPAAAETGNPMARLLARLWAEREHGGIVEVHLVGGTVILPEEFAARWSGGTHGVFASQAADGTVTLTAVAWETVQRIVVRHLSAVPGDMFE